MKEISNVTRLIVSHSRKLSEKAVLHPGNYCTTMTYSRRTRCLVLIGQPVLTVVGSICGQYQ
jgi:hypothetical protein